MSNILHGISITLHKFLQVATDFSARTCERKEWKAQETIEDHSGKLS